MRRVVLGLAVIALLGAACSGGVGPGRGGGRLPAGTSSTASAPPTTTTPSPSALATLGPYLLEVAALDAALKRAATAVNGDVGATTLDLSPAIKAAIEAADPTPAGKAIPAGLPDDLLAHVLLVQSDLVSRWASLHGYASNGATFPLARTDFWGKYALSCLANGAVAAATTKADTHALRSAAARVPPVSPVAPDSRPAADLALLLETVDLQNLGCLSCGGSRMAVVPEIVWYDPPRPAPVVGMPPIAGTIHGIDFEASYSPTEGWQINIHAC